MLFIVWDLCTVATVRLQERRLELASGSGSALLQEFVCLFRNPGLLWDINKSDFDALLLSL